MVTSRVRCLSSPRTPASCPSALVSTRSTRLLALPASGLPVSCLTMSCICRRASLTTGSFIGSSLGNWRRIPRSVTAMKASLAFVLVAAALGAQAQESPFKESEKSYAIPAAEIVAFDTLLNLYDRHHFGCCDFDSNIHTIRRNLRSSWVVDRDPFLVNQLGHPYQGSMYHGFARSAGLG